MVGFVLCITMFDKWSGTPVNMAKILDLFWIKSDGNWNTGKSPRKFTSVKLHQVQQLDKEEPLQHF